MSTTFSTTRAPATAWWLILIQGIALIVVGLLLLTAPLPTTVLLVQLLGFYWLVTGVLALVGIFMDHSLWGWKLFAGILGILAGLAVLRHPLWSTLLIPATLIFLLGIQGCVMGVVNLFQAFSGSGWGTAMLGVINIIFGIVLLSSPAMAVRVLPFVLGVFGILGGIAAIALAFRLRQMPRPQGEVGWHP